ncbi:hypothetical protein BJV77DRAFT_1071085 [Russula vinacea]|nr:hypothetical protein BJV77DRAFT_1071085 [Russula vinacea]
MAPNTIFYAVGVLAWTSLVSAHIAIWHPSMWGFNQSSFPTNRPQDPLMELPFDKWWFHGHLEYPPHPDDIMQLPVGENTTVQLSCDKDATTYWESGPGGDQQSTEHPDSPCPGAPTSEFHTNGINDLGGLYFNGFQCNFENANSNKTVGPSQVARRCGPEEANNYTWNYSNCTYGPKQPLYWLQAERNNMFEGYYSPPLLNDCDYNTTTSTPTPLSNSTAPTSAPASNSTVPASNSTTSALNPTASASDSTVPTGQPSQTPSSSLSSQGPQPSSGTSSPVAQPSVSTIEALEAQAPARGRNRLGVPDGPSLLSRHLLRRQHHRTRRQHARAFPTPLVSLVSASAGYPDASPESTSDPTGQPDSPSPTPTDGSDPDDDAPCTYSDDSMPTPSSSDPSQLSPSSSSPSLVTQTPAADNSTSTPDPAAQSPTGANDPASLNTGTSTDSGTGMPMPTGTAGTDSGSDGSNGNGTNVKRRPGKSEQAVRRRAWGAHHRRAGQPSQPPSSALPESTSDPAGQPDSPTPTFFDSPTPTNSDSPTPTDPDSPTPTFFDSPTPTNSDSPTPTDSGSPTPTFFDSPTRTDPDPPTPTPTDGSDPGGDAPCTHSGDSSMMPMPTRSGSDSDPSQLSPSSSSPLSPLVTPTAAADSSTSTSTPDPAAQSPTDSNDPAALNTGTGTDSGAGMPMPTGTAGYSNSSSDSDGSNGNGTNPKRQPGKNGRLRRTVYAAPGARSTAALLATTITKRELLGARTQYRKPRMAARRMHMFPTIPNVADARIVVTVLTVSQI